MKASIKISALFLLLVSFTLTTNAQKSSEEDAIKAVLEKETKAFVEIDYKTWSDTWAHVPYAFWSLADTTDVNSFSGWDVIDASFAEYFKSSKPSVAKIDRTWHYIKVFGNAAYVRFTQNVSDDIMRPGQAQVRVLEKIKGQWKIVCVTVIAIEKDNKPKL
ncbi:MAG TPA: hypothetical protein PLJ60_03875 [Chryseolinea sp.]|nr:hypothetical protein [Chryseolinea sp.]